MLVRRHAQERRPQKVAAATPMYGAVRSTPDLTAFDAVPNQVPLTEGVVTPPACGVDTLGTTPTGPGDRPREPQRLNTVRIEEG